MNPHKSHKDLRDKPAVRRPKPFVPGEIDEGIRRAVELLQAHDIETYESCAGGPGHCYPVPTIRFYGKPEAGWRAVSVCLTYALPVSNLRRVWGILDGLEPTGPFWEITFHDRVY